MDNNASGGPSGPDFRDPTPADLEMLRDAMAGKPLPRKAGEGIADMEARIEQLIQQRRRVVDQMSGIIPTGPFDTRFAQLEQRLSELNAQIKEATDRLAEYQVQQQGLN
jgi:aspartate aminotransferase-like enzyme